MYSIDLYEHNVSTGESLGVISDVAVFLVQLSTTVISQPVMTPATGHASTHLIISSCSHIYLTIRLAIITGTNCPERQFLIINPIYSQNT